jgi:hypothetical protein
MNKYNILVAVLVMLCLGNAAYRVYTTYQKIVHSQQDEVHNGLVK